MPLAYTGYDWAVLGLYVALLAVETWWLLGRLKAAKTSKLQD